MKNIPNLVHQLICTLSVCVNVLILLVQFLYISSTRKTQKKSNPKKLKSSGSVTTPKTPSEAAVVFKTYDKSSGASLRSSKCKFPLTLGQKKTKTIEQVLEELGVGQSV